MSTIESLQHWYQSQCNEDWEHSYGISIETLDNPGWSLTIDLKGTALEARPFPAVSYGIGKGDEPTGNDWLTCKVERKKFIGHGGPSKLEEMINTFLSWAKEDVR